MKLGQSDPRNRVKSERTDRAVSPVIGVILMVAITVILAAVIGVFVLGLGDELGEAAPSNSISISGDYGVDANNGEEIEDLDFTISHDSGDSVAVDDVDVVVRVDGQTDARQGLDTFITNSDEFSVGDSISISDTSDFDDGFQETGADDVEVEVQLVHTPSDSIIADGEIDHDSSMDNTA